MSSAFAMSETEGHNGPSVQSHASAGALKIEALSNRNEDEVLAFFARRSLQTVFMAGLIRDNGLVSFSNRGTFFGCRDQKGLLEGVALIGQKTLVDTISTPALQTLGRLVTENRTAHLIRGEQHQIELLLEYYAASGRQPRLLCGEILMEQVAPARGVEPEPNLRLATGDDLAVVTSINAAMAMEETGINPMTRDPQGMLERTERRIDQGRVWVLTQNDRTVFKADVISDTPQVVFIEGVFVHWQERRKGHGLRCVTQLARNLLTRTNSICLVVNTENNRARDFYEKAGFKFTSSYQTAYFAALSGAKDGTGSAD